MERLKQSANKLWLELNRNPARFKSRLSKLLWLGYPIIFLHAYLRHLIWVTLGCLLACVIVGQIDHVVSWIGWMPPWAALLVFITPPRHVKTRQQQIRLQLSQYPKLFSALRQLNRHQGKPMPTIFLSDTSQALAVHVPRFVFFGWRRPQLEIGLQALLVLSPYQLHGMLASAFAHLSDPAGRANGRALATLSRLSKFLVWFNCFTHSRWVQKLNGLLTQTVSCQLVLQHATVFAADRRASARISKKSVAQGIAGSCLFEIWLSQHFWRPWLAMNRGCSVAGLTPFVDLYDFCSHYPFTREELLAEAVHQLKDAPGILTRRPTLGQRLAALDAPIDWELPVGPCAAEWWFGDDLPSLLAEMDAQWRKAAQSNGSFG